LEMWRRYHAIFWPITAILRNVEKISRNIVTDYCYPWKCGEYVTQYCVRLLLSLEMWRICHVILCPITVILGNVEKVSSNIVTDDCYPWKYVEDVTHCCRQWLLSLEMWRRYHAILWPMTAILRNVEKISHNIVAYYCYPWKCGEYPAYKHGS
jgi:hypothetical protein